MNDFDNFRVADGSNICRGCLKTGDDVKLATKMVSIQYHQLCSQNLNLQDVRTVHLCVYCKTLVRKTTNFIRQCRDVNEYWDKMCLMMPHSIPNTHFRLTKFVGDVNVYLPDSDMTLSSERDVKMESWDGDDDHFDDRTGTADDRTGTADNRTGTTDDRTGTSDDDVPLNKLKKETDDAIKLELFDVRPSKEKRKRKKLKVNKKERHADETQPIKTESGAMRPARTAKRKKVKNEKSLRNGFSSRMVQETEEYTVIKLTHEEVLLEMGDRAKTDRYLRAPYKCEMCVKGFNFEDVLRKHSAKHAPRNDWLCCVLCQQYCPTVVSLRGHMKSHTSRYKCKVCGAVKLGRQNLLEHHTNTHTFKSVTYKCKECDFFTERTVLQRHARTHAKEEPLTCDKCGNIFKNIETLRVHMLRHEDGGRHRCPDCERTFVYPALLRAHARAHHAPRDRRDHYCVECDLRFKTRDNLKTHFKKSKAHRDPNQLTRRPTPAADCTHACATCRRRYRSRHALRAHCLRAHPARGAPPRPPARPHACHLCGHRFAQRAVLVKHIRVHTGERPYACAECGQSFAQHATRYTHTRLVHRKLPRSVKKCQDTILQAKQEDATTEVMKSDPISA